MAIVFSSLMITGSLIFLGVQISNSKASLSNTDLEELKKLVAKDEGLAPSEPQIGKIKPVDVNSDHIRGNPNAEISVIEYSDFECPFCKKIHPILQQVVDTYGDTVNWVYRHYPLSFHDPLATKEAMATECAAEQGGNDAFWKYTDLIFATSTSGGNGLADEQFPQIAQKVGLNVSEFQDCLNSEKYLRHVQQDMTEGAEAGIDGTPGNILLKNSTQEAKLISGAQPFASFQSAIDELLAE